MTGWRKRQVVEMAREAGLRSAVLLHMYGKENALCDSEIEELRQLERFAELVRADALAEQPAQETAPLRDAIVVNLVREGINKHKARELADHFINLTNAQPTVPDLIHHTDTSETLEYIQGWNDCRAETLKMRKP